MGGREGPESTHRPELPSAHITGCRENRAGGTLWLLLGLTSLIM